MTWKVLKKVIKKILRKETSYPVENGVVFVHKTPDHRNIGDFLCSPRHYFLFEGALPGLKILGGGAYSGLAIKKVENLKWDFNKTVLWGVGQSQVFEKDPLNKVKDLPYVLWGTRDYDLIEDYNHFLPCVSCLHPMLDAEPGSETLLFLNVDPAVTPPEVKMRLYEIAKKSKWSILFNDCSIDDFKKIFNNSNVVITNSYHGAYWGLLSGKKVVPMGYSSKFKSLLSSFSISPDRLIKISRGESDSLAKAIQHCSIDKDSVMIENSREVLSIFRTINRDFARNLEAYGLVSTVVEKSL